MSAVDIAHRAAQVGLRERVGSGLGALLANLPEPESQAAMEAYSRAALPLVAGGQRSAAMLALAYMERVAPGRGASLERALRGVQVDAEAPVVRSPVLRLWGLLADGADPSEATAASASYADALASGDLQVAERSGLMEGASASGREVIGWRKQLAGSACEWCRLVGFERVYNSAETVPFHDRDSCGVAPVLGAESERRAGVGTVLRRELAAPDPRR